MDKYKNFSVEDFLQDEFFNHWVKYPSQEDDGLWEKWLKNNPEKQETVEQAKNMIMAFAQQPKQLSEDFYSRLKTRIDSSISNQTYKETKTISILSLLKMVAVFTGLVIGVYVLFHSLQHDSFTYYSSAYAETKKVRLPDGSEVMLNANSLLKYKNTSNADSREVWLKGEAFFYIQHINDQEKTPVKFIVHAKNVDVEVLGTQFNINSHTEDNIQVLLTKGKVRLSVPEGRVPPLIMHPNDLASFNNKTKRININKVNPEEYIAWLDHKYIFEKTTLEELSNGLSRYYGNTFTIEDAKMRQQRLSGTLELQDEGTLIQTLSALLGVPVNKNGNNIIIGSK